MIQALAPKKFMTQALVLTLALNFTGVLPVIHQAMADTSMDLQTITAQSQILDDGLKLQIRRARHPGTPGTPAGVPSASDMAKLEADFLAWKGMIERVLALPSEPAKPGDSYLPTDAKLRGINTYLNELTMLATLRIALGLTHGPSWSDAYALLVPRAVLAEIPGLGTLSTNRMGDRFMPMIVDRGEEGSTEAAHLKLSASLVQGLELGRLADVQNDDTNLTMIKYMATRQLLSNLSDLRYLKQDHSIEIPQIPAPLREKLETMGLASVIADEQFRAVAEPGSRASLIKTYSSVSSQFPTFVTDALVAGLATAVAKTPQDAAAAKGPLQEVLVAAEKDNLASALEQEIASSSAPFSTQSAKELDQSLRMALANAKANTQLQKIMELLANQMLGDLNVAQRRSVMDQLDARKASYLAQITPDAARSWQNAAKHATEQLLYTDQRNEFIEKLLLHAPEAVKELQRTVSGDEIDPQLLSSVFARDLAKLGPSENAGNWFYQIRSAGTWIASRAKYNELLVKQTETAVLVGGIADAAKVEDFISHHDFTPQLPQMPNTDPVLTRRISDRIANARREDIRALVKYGTWMGFHGVYAGANPSVSEVLTNKDKADEYYKRLDESTETQYPVLGTQISVTSADGTESPVKLADALAALNPNRTSSQEQLDKAGLLVDQSLLIIESKIRKDLETIGNAKSGAEIEKVVTSSMMLSLVMHGFPEFHLYEEQFIEEMLSPSITDQVMRRYAGPAMMYGFGAVMIIKGINWGAKKLLKKSLFPFSNVAAWGIESVFAGFMRAAVVLIIADEIYNVSQVAHESGQRDQQEDFFFCSAEGGCFTDAGTLNDANKAYSWAKWTLVGRAIADVGFFYFPMARNMVNMMGDRVVLAELAGDNQAFKKMGGQPGEFGTLESRMKIARALREGRPVGPEVVEANPANGNAWLMVDQGKIRMPGVDIPLPGGGGNGWIRFSDALIIAELESSVPKMSAEAWSEFEQSYARLSAKLKTGKAYRLNTVTDRLAIEDAFKTLDLNAKKPGSWEKIEDARDVHERAAPTKEAANKVNRAAKFLKTYLAAAPDVKTREFVPATSAERKLLNAFKRSPNLEQFWASFASDETAGLRLTVPETLTAKPIPPINASGSRGVHN